MVEFSSVLKESPMDKPSDTIQYVTLEYPTPPQPLLIDKFFGGITQLQNEITALDLEMEQLKKICNKILES